MKKLCIFCLTVMLVFFGAAVWQPANALASYTGSPPPRRRVTPPSRRPEPPRRSAPLASVRPSQPARVQPSAYGAPASRQQAVSPKSDREVLETAAKKLRAFGNRDLANRLLEILDKMDQDNS